MTKFIDRFKQYGDYSLRGMRKTAISMLPSDRSELNALYEELNRGREVLENEDLLNMYLYSYGKMHKFKLVKAILRLFEHVDFNNEEIEIYDWGCGQGIATMCFLDCLNYFEIKPDVKGIFLIDQSYAATQRASGVIECLIPHCQVKTIVKDLDSLNDCDFVSSDSKKIHLFSNILDVESYDLSQFARLFQRSFFGNNYIVCVGPCYNRERLEAFFEYIGPDTCYDKLVYNRGEWLNDWSIALQICYKHVVKQHLNSPDREPVVLNKLNFGNCEFGLSAQKTTLSGKKFYWVLIYFPKGEVWYCATSESFTELLGDNADDSILAKVISEHQNKYEIACLIDHVSGKKSTFEDGTPIYCIRKRAHRRPASW